MEYWGKPPEALCAYHLINSACGCYQWGWEGGWASCGWTARYYSDLANPLSARESPVGP